MEYTVLSACKAWGITPEAFRALAIEDQADMIALVQIQSRMGSVEAQEDRQNADIARK